VVHYRLGQYKEAVATFGRGVQNNKGQETASDLYFLAMCYQRLGESAKAKGCYDQAVRWQEQAKLAPDQEEELHDFRAEADTVLGKNPEP
jgi:TolA-binding protein